MADKVTFLAVFQDVGPAADALDKLREMGLGDDQMNVISGVPVTEAMLGRPHQWTNVPRLALGGSLAGFLVGLFFAVGTPDMYFVLVGGQPKIPVPPSVIVLFEMTMLGMLISTFLGVFLDSRFPAYEPMEYVSEISDGKIAILFKCEPDMEKNFETAMTEIGAESIKHAEARTL